MTYLIPITAVKQYFNGNSTTVIGAMNYYGDYTTECLLKKMTYHKKKQDFTEPKHICAHFLS